jgi:hypothetical protein
MNWNWITNLKLRLTIGGCILSILGVVIMVVRNVLIGGGLLILGIIMLIIGLLWKPAKKESKSN